MILTKYTRGASMYLETNPTKILGNNIVGYKIVGIKF